MRSRFPGLFPLFNLKAYDGTDVALLSFGEKSIILDSQKTYASGKVSNTRY